MNVTRRNIAEIVELEAQFEQQRGWMERFLARIASWVGSLTCIGIHVGWFVVWIAINSRAHPRHRFDPYPYPLLGTIVSCEAVIFSTIVLIEQNWMARLDKRRDHLHLQVNMLAEQEITKVLELQQLICKRLGIREAARDMELAALTKLTEVQDLAEQIGDLMEEG